MLLFFSKQNGYCILTPSKGTIFCNISHVFIKKDGYFNGQQNNYTKTGYLKINLPIKQNGQAKLQVFMYLISIALLFRIEVKLLWL